jgi:hypothetical protein
MENSEHVPQDNRSCETTAPPSTRDHKPSFSASRSPFKYNGCRRRIRSRTNVEYHPRSRAGHSIPKRAGYCANSSHGPVSALSQSRTAERVRRPFCSRRKSKLWVPKSSCIIGNSPLSKSESGGATDAYKRHNSSTLVSSSHAGGRSVPARKV